MDKIVHICGIGFDMCYCSPHNLQVIKELIFIIAFEIYSIHYTTDQFHNSTSMLLIF